MIAPTAFDPWVTAQGSRTDKAYSSASTRDAAQQFEALLIRQFLANARSTSWLNDQQESESGWRDIADDSLAGYLLKAGGLGLSKQVESMINQSRMAGIGSTKSDGSLDGPASSKRELLNPYTESAVNKKIGANAQLGPGPARSK